MNMEEPNECPLILERESLGIFYFIGKTLVILTYESEYLSYEIENAPRGLHCGGMVDVADATRRRRRILRSRILFYVIGKLFFGTRRK